MRALLLTIGSRGDVQPFVALGQALMARGHDVTLATHAAFAPLARSHGVSHLTVEGDPAALLATEDGKRWIEQGAHPIRFVQGGVRLMRPLVARFLDDLDPLVRDTDVLVTGHNAIAASWLAHHRGIPTVLAILAPLVPTRAFMSCMSPVPPVTTSWINLASHHAVEQLMWHPFRPAVDAWCRRLSLPGVPLDGPMAWFRRSGQPILLAHSAALIPPAPDWPTQLTVTGPWFLEGHATWKPPPELTAFLESGPAPVVVGFGSMTDTDPGGLAELVVQALKLSNQRGILLAGWTGLRAAAGTVGILNLDDAPHGWLLPRAAAMVTHGGAGTVSAALRAGIPVVTVPFFADQAFWGDAALHAGAGVMPGARRSITVGSLAAAIDRAVQSPSLREGARAVRNAMTHEHGLDAAVGVIERQVRA